MAPATMPRSPAAADFYRRGIDILTQKGVPFLIGGAYALGHYTGISRDTKDLDVFLQPADCRRALAIFADWGFRAELTFPHWLGKVFAEDHFIDLIFSSGNGVVRVDGDWFAHAEEATILDRRVRLCPPEETIWSKSFIMERERFDGADIAHLLRAKAPRLDWPRLRWRFGSHWRLLLAHLVLFGYIYPGELTMIPPGVLTELLDQARREGEVSTTADPVCRGTLLSREQDLTDVHCWGYEDARLAPPGPDVGRRCRPLDGRHRRRHAGPA